MPLSFNEVRKRAIAFSHEWKDEANENAEAQTFWNEFFAIFGVTRRRLASYEAPVKKLTGKDGFIDLFWKGMLIVEHKSKGKDLDRAHQQALDYFPGIKEEELPKYILVSDFARFRLYDLDEDETYEFALDQLEKNIHRFDFILGFKKQKIVDEDPVNIQAAERMGRLHDALRDAGYSGHALEVFLVRIMFCMFADDTGIFPKDAFTYFVEHRTRPDGIDVGPQLAHLFQVLNTPEESRQKTLDEDLQVFPYVNGLLFEETLHFPSFDSDMRKTLLDCCHFDWSGVSPAIFGSLFQSVMDAERRRELGGHYTSERNILKVVRSLFLDELRAEAMKAWSNEKKLRDLLLKLASLRFFDPACGCGNFLVITYREVRELEIEIRVRLKALSKTPTQQIFIEAGMGLDVDAFYGIELEEFPANIARVAMWLVDHQMNKRLSQALGIYYVRLPLKKSANIHLGNALRMNWEKVIPAENVSYVLGNPPYVGKKRRNPQQDADMGLTMKGKVAGYKVLDYVACWYYKAAEYIQGTNVEVAFVSTNAITHGEQVAVLWNALSALGVRINFAHRTFAWTSEARGKAAVHVVIIGFGLYDRKKKQLFDYANNSQEPVEVQASNINAYLVDMPNLLIAKRSKPISAVPPITFGSMPNDDGNLVLSDGEKLQLLLEHPSAAPLVRPLLSAEEFLHGEKRWCLWLKDVPSSEIKKHRKILLRVAAVKTYRQKSKRPQTRRAAAYPALFAEIRQPDTDYLVLPRHSSETRRYIPIDRRSRDEIVSDSCACIPGATLYHFGILSSYMHTLWLRQIGGKIKSDFRYSNKVVYNNFPWPIDPPPKAVAAVKKHADAILTLRATFVTQTLADLYDPLTAPKPLVKLHEKLDRAVEKCYGLKPSSSDLVKLHTLLELYLELAPTSADVGGLVEAEDDD